MRIQLSDHFTYPRLLRFVLPSVLMILCTSIYSIVDGFFIANFVGKTPFAAINLVMPVLMGVATIGFMIGTGGSAIVSKTLGKGKTNLANQYFTLLVCFAFLLGVVVSALGFIFAEQLSALLGADGVLFEDCVLYARILFIAAPFFVLQFVFQSFFIVAEKPDLSLKVNLIAGITNAILDYVLILVIPLGLIGAAIATAIGQIVGAVIPVLYFARKNDSLLCFRRTPFYGNILGHVCVNGSSEMVTNLSTSIINILYNFHLMNLAGENGIAAYGVIMYVNIVFMAIFLGYSLGSAPIVSYHYGAENTNELKSLFQKSIVILIITDVLLVTVSELVAKPLVGIFTSYDIELFEMTTRGFQLYALSFLIMGFNVWGSAFFTALNNGVVSAMISFLRTFVFQVAVVSILPEFWGLDGIWLSIAVAELLAFVVTTSFVIAKRKHYQYV